MLDTRVEAGVEAAPGGAPALPPPTRRRAGPPPWRTIRGNQFFWVLAGAFLLAALYGRVALLNLTSGVVGGDSDGYDNVWNNWWVKTALLDLHRSPFYNDYIYYPLGISLRYHTLNPLNGVLTLPFNLLFGYLPTLNMLLVLALVPTLFCAFLLLRDQVSNPWAAFAGAALFTYANRNVLFFFSLGQTNMITMHWLPLYLFVLFRALHGRPVWSATGALVGRDSRRWPLYAVYAVATLLAMSLTDWQYVMYAVFTTVLYFLFLLATRRPRSEKRALFARLAAIGGGYAAIVAWPLLIPMIQEAAASPWLAVGYQSTVHSSDLLDLLGPGLGNPGYLAVGIAALGLGAAWRRGQRERELGLFWALLALLFYVITLGPRLILNGHITDIPMLYSLIERLPVFNIGRDPGRFNIVALLALSTLVAFGLRRIMDFGFAILDFGFWNRLQPIRDPQSAIRNPRSAIQNRKSKIQNRKSQISALVVLAFLGVALFGFMVEVGAASKVDAPDWPAFYSEIAQDPDQYAILELPVYPDRGRGATHYNMYQVLHQKLRFAGRLARDHKQDNPNNFVKTASLFRHLWLVDAPLRQRDLSYPHQDFLIHTDYATQGIPILNYYHTRYIVLYKEAIRPDDWRLYDALLSQVLGSGVQPYRDEPLVRVYKIPDGPPAANPLTLDVGVGWFPSGVNKAGQIYRWADNTSIDPGTGLLLSPVSEFYSMNLRQEAVPAAFSFTAYSWKVARTLKVALNGHEIASIALAPTQTDKQVTLELLMPSGNNKITLSSPEPAQPAGTPQDKRLLSFGLYGVALTAK